MKRIAVISVAFLSTLFLVSVAGVSAQEKIVIPLRFNLEVQQGVGWGIAFTHE